jgi:hypothetical protein
VLNIELLRERAPLKVKAWEGRCGQNKKECDTLAGELCFHENKLPGNLKSHTHSCCFSFSIDILQTIITSSNCLSVSDDKLCGYTVVKHALIFG